MCEIVENDRENEKREQNCQTRKLVCPLKGRRIERGEPQTQHGPEEASARQRLLLRGVWPGAGMAWALVPVLWASIGWLPREVGPSACCGGFQRRQLALC